jgi:hypothetical protein
MQWVRAFFSVLFVLGVLLISSFIVAMSGLDVALARLGVRPGMRYSEAYQLITNWRAILTLLFTTGLVLAVYAIRHPGELPRKFDRFKAWLREATPGRLVVIWIVAVCTIIGYLAAFYATWHFVAKRLTARPAAPTTTPLLARLAELDSAQRAGLISADEHAAKRSEILQAY